MQKQKGMATILIVMLVGISLAAAAMGVIHSSRSSQEKQLAVHAMTHSQSGAWSGVEAFRQYLNVLDAAQLDALGDTVNINLGSAYGAIVANNISVATVAANRRVTADIVNTHATAKSTSAIQVVYEVTLGGGASTPASFDGHLNFYDDLLIEGNVNITNGLGNGSGNPSDSTDLGAQTISVQGNITVSNILLQNVRVLNSTGDIFLDSAVTLDQVYANGDVTLDRSAEVARVYSRGSVNIAGGGAEADFIYANGDISINSSGSGDFVVEEANTLANVFVRKIGGSTIGKILAGNNVVIGEGREFSKRIDSIHNKGDITFVNARRFGSVGEIKGEGDMQCDALSASDLNGPGTYSINGTGDSNTCNNLITTGAANSVPLMAEVQPFTLDAVIIDVWQLKGDANYIIEYDPINNRTLVTVNQVNGLNDATYILGSVNSRGSYLCEALDGSGNCTNTNPRPLCLGHHANNSCFDFLSYNALTQSANWELDGTATAPGVYWVDGNLIVGSGTNTTTMLVTGNLTTSGLLRQYAANIGSKADICDIAGVNIERHDPSMKLNYVEWFRGQYPTNLCGSDGSAYSPISTGNIAFAVGGYPSGDGTGRYKGGNLVIETNNEIFGALLAGNYLETNGNTDVNGYVTASGLGEERSGIENLIGASTNININSDVPDYNPADIPNMGSNSGTPVQQEVKILWSRYL